MGEKDKNKLSSSFHEMKKDIYDAFLENLNQTKLILRIFTQNLEKLKDLEKDIKTAVTSKKEKGFFNF